jgi:hypothetical protein
MLLLVDICQGINPTRALALIGESVKGNNVEWGWEIPKLSKIFAKIVTKKISINEFGIRSSWYGHNKTGHDKAMGIYPFFVMQFVHPYFRPPREWDFSTPHEHFKHRDIKFLHKKWKRFIKIMENSQ